MSAFHQLLLVSGIGCNPTVCIADLSKGKKNTLFLLFITILHTRDIPMYTFPHTVYICKNIYNC